MVSIPFKHLLLPLGFFISTVLLARRNKGDEAKTVNKIFN